MLVLVGLPLPWQQRKKGPEKNEGRERGSTPPFTLVWQGCECSPNANRHFRLQGDELTSGVPHLMSKVHWAHYWRWEISQKEVFIWRLAKSSEELALENMAASRECRRSGEYPIKTVFNILKEQEEVWRRTWERNILGGRMVLNFTNEVDWNFTKRLNRLDCFWVTVQRQGRKIMLFKYEGSDGDYVKIILCLFLHKDQTKNKLMWNCLVQC